MLLTPGIEYLLGLIPLASLPPLTLFVFFSLVETSTSTSTRVLAYIFITPIIQLFKLFWSWNARSRDIQRLGAQEMPLWGGKWPGNLDLLLKFSDHMDNGFPGDGLDDATQALGLSFRTKFLGADMVITSDPANIKTVLATDFDGYHKGPHVNKAFRSFLGTGIFGADGDMWKLHRNLARPFFSKDRISDLDIFRDHADEAMEKAKARLKEGFAVDIQDLISRFTLDAATSFILGSCVNYLSAPIPYPEGTEAAKNAPKTKYACEEFEKAFTSAQVKIIGRARIGPFWPLAEIFGDAMADDRIAIDRFMDPIIEKALSEKAGSQDKTHDNLEDSLLGDLVNQVTDPEILRDAVLNMLVAAADTTSSLLTFAAYALYKYPDITARLRQEIIDKFGHSRAPTYEDIKGMKYMRAFLNETLRLFPSVPFDFRETKKATTWPSNVPGEKPYYLAPGTTIMYATILTQKNKDFWGPDAEAFDPERWLDDRNKEYLLPNPFIFIPFNAGPRFCLGQQFAYNQVSFFLIRLLQSFDSIVHCKDAQPESARPPASWNDQEHAGKTKVGCEVWPITHLTMHVRGGFWVKMTEAPTNDD